MYFIVLFALKYFHMFHLIARFQLSTILDFSSFSVEYNRTLHCSSPAGPSSTYCKILYLCMSITFAVVVVFAINFERLSLFPDQLFNGIAHTYVSVSAYFSVDAVSDSIEVNIEDAQQATVSAYPKL